MKILNFKNWFKKKNLNNNEIKDFIFVPLEVLNDSNYTKGDSQSGFSRILKTKHFQNTKKIRHPSGTTMIRVSDYDALKKAKQEESSKNKNLKMISYKAPTNTISKRSPESKKSWRY